MTGSPEADLVRPSPSGPVSSVGPGRAGLVFIAYIASQACVGGLGGLAIGVWLAASGELQTPDAASDAIGSYLVPIVVAAMLVSGAVVLLLAWLSWPAHAQGGRFQPLGWVGCRAHEAMVAAAAGSLIAGLYVLLISAGIVPEPEHVGPLTQAISAGGWSLHVWAVMALLLAPPIEEFLFRGVLLAGFSRNWSTASAGTLVTLLFLGAHFSELTHGPAVMAITMVGGATVVARTTTGSLVPAVVLHAAYNCVIVVAAYVHAA